MEELGLEWEVLVQIRIPDTHRIKSRIWPQQQQPQLNTKRCTR
jgi:hypothetical protein